MKGNKLSLRLIKYEIVNVVTNILIIIFGAIFPIGITLILAFSITPDYGVSLWHTQLFIQNIVLIPMATMLMGHAVNYANELESGAIIRMKLFGFKDRTLFTAKFIANFVFFVFSLILYGIVLSVVLDVSAPSIGAIITFIVFSLVYAGSMFVLGHAVATLCGRYGTTFGIIMFLYFGFMILGGIMGNGAAALPDGIRHISMALPLYYLTKDFLSFWNGGTLDFLPFTLTTVGLAVFSVLLLILSFYLTKKGKINQKPKPVYYD
jgi:ABC-2 type transport system permease protein